MATKAHSISRYRALRGKSVSEPRRDVDDQPAIPNMDNITPSPLRFDKSSREERPKTRETLRAADTSVDDRHSPTFVPPLPLSQKEHLVNTRPKAAVIPSRPKFGQPSSPTLLGLRKADQVSTSLTYATDDVNSSDNIATSHQFQNKSSGDLKTQDREHAVELEGTTPSVVTPPREPSPFSQTAAMTESMLFEQVAEQEKLLHQRLMCPGSSVTSLASSSTFTFASRTPPKSPMFGKFDSFLRGLTSKALPSPASSATASVASSQTQNTDSLLPSTTRTGYMQQLMTPPISPVSSFTEHKMNHVYVRYRGEYKDIPIMNATDTVDILRQASGLMRHPINSAASVVFECYAALGLERRLRRYERIDEVIDSWPRDAQNSLHIGHALDVNSDKDLDFASVPETPPGFTLQLSLCIQPGKWQKRWVTLYQDGHIVASKKEEGYCHQVCHLSICDIYTPTPDRSRPSPIESLKPPKKYMFALKAQNKPATFLDPDNYVHYFCTDDEAVASKFHGMVHAWRSWYIVKRRQNQRKRMVEAKAVELPPQITPIKHEPKKSINYLEVFPGHKLKVSCDDTPYTIGVIASEPLVDEKLFDKALEDFGRDWIPEQQQSCVSPKTPGTLDSGILIMTPSNNKTSFEPSSPSEDRRRRQSLNKTLATQMNGTAQIVNREGTAGVTISVTEPKCDDTSLPPSQPLKPQNSSWLPSASEHSAKIKALDRQSSPISQPQRPATSAGPAGRNSLQPPNGDRRRRLAQYNHNRPSESEIDWVMASRFFEQRPQGAQQRVISSRPSMPLLKEEGQSGRRGSSNVRREASLARPSTSGGERASSGRQQGRSRASSSAGSSGRRGPAVASGEPLPPVPGVPRFHSKQTASLQCNATPRQRTKVRDANIRAAAGMSAPNMLSGGRGWMTRPSDANSYAGEAL